jgi:hypothetical protein
LFSKYKIKISIFILDKYSFTELKMGEMRKWSLKNHYLVELLTKHT